MFEHKIVFNSEMIEPAMAHIIGIHYARVEEIRNADGSIFEYVGKQSQLLSACSNFWYTIEAIMSLSVGTSGATHFSIAAGNEKLKVADYIEAVTGIDPMNTDDIMFNFKGV